MVSCIIKHVYNQICRIINLSQMIYDFIIWLYDLKVKLNIA